MNKITNNMLADLQAAFCSVSAELPDATPESIYEVGAVWYGNWRTHADKGRFGTDQKPLHNACISKQAADNMVFTMAPITSFVHSEKCVVLPRGTIPGGRMTVSYLLPFLRLRASRRTLDRHFVYRCNLPDVYVKQMCAIC